MRARLFSSKVPCGPRGARGAQDRYETEYWGLSTREGIEWLNRHGDGSRPVVLGSPQSIIKPYAHPEWRFQALKDDVALAPHKPFYYLAMPKHAMQYRFPAAPPLSTPSNDKAGR